MPPLPEKTPMDLYELVAQRLGWGAALVRAFARIETPAADEDPRWIRFDARRWRRHRQDTAAARKFDGAGNVNDIGRRWAQYYRMSEADPTAAMLAHHFGFAQIPAESHKFAACETPELFLAAMLTLEGQAHCFVAFAQSSPRLVELGRRLDPAPRPRAGGGIWRLGDLSEIASIWSGAEPGRQNVDKRLELQLCYGVADQMVRSYSRGPHDDSRGGSRAIAA